MPWSVSVDGATRTVTTVYAGVLSPAALRDAVEATLAACQAHQLVRLLADCSQLEGGHSVLDLYDTAESIGERPGAALFKEAVLLPPTAAATAADTVHFWETTATNRGIQVRIFADLDTALAWLTSDIESAL